MCYNLDIISSRLITDESGQLFPDWCRESICHQSACQSQVREIMQLFWTVGRGREADPIFVVCVKNRSPFRSFLLFTFKLSFCLHLPFVIFERKKQSVHPPECQSVWILSPKPSCSHSQCLATGTAFILKINKQGQGCMATHHCTQPKSSFICRLESFQSPLM